jgi:hypothetical protein
MISDPTPPEATWQPILTAGGPNTPQAVRSLLKRCLKKDPRQRLQAIGEARIAIDEKLSGEGATLLCPVITNASGQLIYFGAKWGVFLRSVEGDDPLIRGETHPSSEAPANHCEFEPTEGKPSEFLSR